MSKQGIKLAQTVFIAVDKIFDSSQNNRKMTRFPLVKSELDIVYDKKDEKTCRLDTYFMENDGKKYPVMLYIHGGGFVAGDKKYRRAISRWYADMGMYVVNINYGLSPEYKFPKPIEHLVSALNWIGDNAERLNLDLDKIIVSGDSAGGYFAAMLACITTDKKLQERFGVSTDLTFKAAVLNCGIYDIEKALSGKILLNMGEHILDAFASTKPADLKKYEYYDCCSPINFVNEKFPISFITYASEDFFCKGHGPWLKEKLDALKIYNETYFSTEFKDNHCFSLNWKGVCPEQNNEATKKFVQKVINGEI